MDKLLGFVIANSFLALFSFLDKVVKVVKVQSVGEPILIMLASKDTIAVGS